MKTIADISTYTELPRLSFDWTPKGPEFVFDSGGQEYPWTSGPAQPTIYHTNRNTPITFTATVLVAGDDFIQEYLWRFGDGTIGYGPVVQHTFLTTSPATRVSLCVTDNRRRRVCVGQQLNLL